MSHNKSSSQSHSWESATEKIRTPHAWLHVNGWCCPAENLAKIQGDKSRLMPLRP